MSKLKTLYVCQQCSYQAVKWIGRCPGCQNWHTLVEELAGDVSLKEQLPVAFEIQPRLLGDVSLDETMRLKSGMSELDRVLGGGLVPGSVILVGGEPGIGKSTLLLSMSCSLAASGMTVLYVSGEESLQQTKLRAMRLGFSSSPVHLLAHTQLEVIEEAIKRLSPQTVIIDSIQVLQSKDLSSAPGSVGQVRSCAYELVQLVKERRSALFLVGHVTKEGFLAGPKVLEHLVDTVLYFEGEPTSDFRLLRSTKNRFGATHELGVFHMTGEGLVEVSNPSELFLSHRTESVPGCMVTVTLEGSRALLVEVQALTSPCGIGLPRRRTTGVDVNRLSMLVAVLERRVGLHSIAQEDVFVSSLAGIRLPEPGADLGIAIAIASSLKERSTRRGDIAIGEVGLTGEVMPVVNVSQRLHEAKRIGFGRCFLAAHRNLPEPDGMEIIPVGHVREAIELSLES